MAKQTSCAQCGEPLPEDWDSPGNSAPDAEPVCPACAAKHMKSKSQRRKVITTLLDMYGIEEDPEAVDHAVRKKKKRDGAASE